MKAVRVQNTGGPEVLKLAEVVKPQAASGEVLVRNHFAGVNYIDTYHRTGLYPVPLPFIPGREASGVVEAVGKGVSNFKPGDRVAFFSPNTYAEYTSASADRMIRLPESVSFQDGAAALLQGLTTLMLTQETYKVKAGDNVLVHAAAGGMGQLLCQVCKSLGAFVIGTTSTPEKAKIARESGADEIILYTKEDVVEGVKRLTGGVGVSVVYDGVGKSTFDSSLASLRPHGWLICFGNASGKPEPLDILRLTKGSFKLMRPTLFDFISTKQDFERSMSFVQMMQFIMIVTKNLFDNFILPGKIKFNIHKVYEMADAAAAHVDLESRQTTGKLLIKTIEG